MGPKAAPGLESEYKPRLPAGRRPGASSSLLIKRSGVRIPLRAPARIGTEYVRGRRVDLDCLWSSTVVRPKGCQKGCQIEEWAAGTARLETGNTGLEMVGRYIRRSRLFDENAEDYRGCDAPAASLDRVGFRLLDDRGC
jgi:hypothetical protein